MATMRSTQPDPRHHQQSPSANQAQTGDVIGDRYVLEQQLGLGGFGVVFKAHDRLTNTDVAIKLMYDLNSTDLTRVEREITALRMLRLAGVVRLLDEGDTAQARYITMELLEGTHFPGGMMPRIHGWTELAPTALALLDTLGRVHAAGVVHRDLKPANVLVSADGRPTILDFGVSRGANFGATITQAGAMVGTPGYLAPEQVLGERADARSDLYAVGIMLYEALSGRSPHHADGTVALLRARITQLPTPLARLAPTVPREVCEIIDRMLATDPRGRPRSAEDVVAMLRAARSLPQPSLPWLGDDQIVRAVVQSVTQGHSLAVVGPSGSGRTRTLEEAAARLTELGMVVTWLHPAESPFASLGDLKPPESALVELDLAAAEEVVRQTVLTQTAGRILLADDWEALDRWSRRVLLAVQTHVVVVRAMREPDDAPCVHLRPLDATALQDLFGGRQRLLHIPEDAGLALKRRTGGWPRAVDEEVSAWLRSGVAAPKDGRLVLSRTAVDRLLVLLPAPGAAEEGSAAQHHWLGAGQWTSGRGQEESVTAPPPWLNLDAETNELLTWLHLAWPDTHLQVLAAATRTPPWQLEARLAQLAELGGARQLEDGRFEPRWRPPPESVSQFDHVTGVHRALAASLPPGAERRLFHALAAGDPETAGAEAALVAERLVQHGRPAEAEAVLGEALRIVRRSLDAPHELELVGLLIEAAWHINSVQAMELAQYEATRLRQRGTEADHLRQLASAALVVLKQGGPGPLAVASAVLPFANERLDTVRQSIRRLAARGASLETEEALLESMLAWANVRGTPWAHAHVSMWKARLCYRQGRYLEAAQHDSAAVESGQLPLSVQLAAMTWCASSLQSAHRYDDATDWARQALRVAEQGRHIHAAARAERILRAIAYRVGHDMEPDLELVEAVLDAGLSHQAVSVLLTEATIAWRRGNLAVAADLARRGEQEARALGMEPFATTLGLLRAIVDPDAPRPDPQVVKHFGEQVGDPEVAIQVFGLGALALSRPVAEWRPFVMQMAAILGDATRTQRLDFLSSAEAMAAVATGKL